MKQNLDATVKLLNDVSNEDIYDPEFKILMHKMKRVYAKIDNFELMIIRFV